MTTPQNIERRAYATAAKANLTLAEAARQLEISRHTLQKWIAVGYVQVVRFGPKGLELTRVPKTEIARLKSA